MIEGAGSREIESNACKIDWILEIYWIFQREDDKHIEQIVESMDEQLINYLINNEAEMQKTAFSFITFMSYSMFIAPIYGISLGNTDA